MARGGRKMGHVLPSEDAAFTSKAKAELRVKLLREDVAALASDMTKSQAHYTELDRRHRLATIKLRRAESLLGQGLNEDVEALLDQGAA